MSLRKYIGTEQRLWLIGPIGLIMFWLYAFAVTRKGIVRIIVGIPFMAMNVVFNATVGSFIFWEPPREWFFTDRLKRHKNSTGGRRMVAYQICCEMNKADKDHC